MFCSVSLYKHVFGQENIVEVHIGKLASYLHQTRALFNGIYVSQLG